MNLWDTPLHTSGSMAIAYEVFNSLCSREGIEVIERPLRCIGFYMRVDGKRYICLSSKLNGISWLNVAYHELGHHFLHPGLPITLRLAHDSQIQREADAFASGALIALLHLAEMKGARDE